MRTFGYSLGALALATSLVVPAQATAQRNSRRAHPHSAATRSQVSSTSRPCTSDSTCGDYSLAIISALLPSETPGAGSPDAMMTATVVVENVGTAPAPVSFISVAPKERLASARHSVVPALAPGERATIQLPVVSGPNGTQCISITISPAPAQDPATVQVLASAITDLTPSPMVMPELHGWSAMPALPYWPDLPSTPVIVDDTKFANFGEFSLNDVFAAFRSLRSTGV